MIKLKKTVLNFLKSLLYDQIYKYKYLANLNKIKYLLLASPATDPSL